MFIFFAILFIIINMKKNKLLNKIKMKLNLQRLPLFIFNEDKKIVMINKAFLHFFKKNYVGKYPGFLTNKYSELSFCDLSIKELLKKDYIFYYFGQNKEYIFKCYTYSLGVNKKGPIYYSILFEITDMKEKILDRSIHALIKASQLKDNDTGNHIVRIDKYSQTMATHIFNNCPEQFLEIDYDFIESIGKVASMHDIGKIGIPDYILTKPGKLDEKEFKIMQEHTINGAFILSELAGKMARDIALFHHERWDGSGYPYGMREDNIPLSARIVALADVYDALRMKRYYKPAFSHERAVAIITESRGTHFDPTLTDIFLQIQDRFNDIYESLKEVEDDSDDEIYELIPESL